MHPIGSFAQALLDVASKPLQPTLVGSLCFQLRRPARQYHWPMPLDRRRQDEIQLQRQSIHHQRAIVCRAVEIAGLSSTVFANNTHLLARWNRNRDIFKQQFAANCRWQV